MPGVLGLLTEGKEQDIMHQEQLRSTEVMADPGAGCLRSSPGPRSCPSR